MRTRILVVVPIVALGCASVPRPPELEALDQLRARPEVADAKKRSPELVSSSDQLHEQSTEEWRSKDVEESRHDALMSAVKLKTAMALAEQDKARARIAAANKELAKSEEEYGHLARELALVQRLHSASESVAGDKVAAAELAIKAAEVVDAPTHAKAEYAGAKDMLARAQAELKQGNWSAAQADAELARSQAEQAAALAKPLYKTSEEALGRDAAAIPGITVRLERRGDVQRLVLAVYRLFTGRRTAIAPGRDAPLEQIAALAKKYPAYPILVVGHTARGGRRTELLALSFARAQSVSDALVRRGIEDRRIKVSGLGASEPAGVGNVNNRVEVVFVYP